jgi:hypothetical protein
MSRDGGPIAVEDDSVRVHGPLPHEVVTVPLTSIASFVVIADTTQRTPRPILARKHAIWDAGPVQGRERIVIVLKSPMLIEAGASQQARGGSGPTAELPVFDAIGVDLQHASPVADGLRRAGLREAPDLARALSEVVGVPYGPDADAARRAARRTHRLAQAFVVGLPSFLAVLILGGFWVLHSVAGRTPAPAAVLAGSLAGLALAAAVAPSLLGRAGGRIGDFRLQTAVMMGFWALGAVGVRVSATELHPWGAAAKVLVPACIAAGWGIGVWVGLRMVGPPPELVDASSVAPVAPVARPDAARPAFSAGARLLLAALAVAVLMWSVGREVAVDPWGQARAALVRAEDLPVGWAPDGDPLVRLVGEYLEVTICGSADDLPAHVAGMSAGFYRDEQPDGQVTGSIIQGAVVAETEALAAREFEGVDAPDYLECTERAVIRDARDWFTGAVVEPDTVFHVREPVTGLPAEVDGRVLDRFELRYPRTGRGPAVVHVAFVRLRVDALIVRLPVTTFGTPIPDDELDAIIRAVAAAAVDAA